MAALFTPRLKKLSVDMGLREDDDDQDLLTNDERKLNLKIADGLDGSADGLERMLANHLIGDSHGTSNQPLDVGALSRQIAQQRAEAAELRSAAGVDQ